MPFLPWPKIDGPAIYDADASYVKSLEWKCGGCEQTFPAPCIHKCMNDKWYNWRTRCELCSSNGFMEGIGGRRAECPCVERRKL